MVVEVGDEGLAKNLMPIRELLNRGWIRGAVVITAVVAMLVLAIVIAGYEPPPSQDTYEAVLKTNLAALREGIRTYRDDHGLGPRSLEELVADGYLARVPVDPMNSNSATWDVERADDGTIIGVRSASKKRAREGTYYRNW